ncbi:MAG: redoxin domain-containing protein [Patescibacteria group bacterium]
MNELHVPYTLPLINSPLPDLSLKIFQNNADKLVKLSDYRGKWLILFFYPADFTFICPTELEELADLYFEFQKLNAEVMSVSTDTVFVHKAWHDHSPSIKKIQFPMAADPTGNLCRALGTYIANEGLSLRGSFIVDPDGMIKAYEMHANNIGRSASELLRKLQAAIFVREHGGEVCPASWRPGAATLKPSLELVGKI